jgi:heme/copper-type cytochrome/quinol oxidase subunit 3
MAATPVPAPSVGRATTPTLVACLAGGAALMMAMTGLGGAYAISRYSVRRANPREQFFPSTMKFDNYAAFIVGLTLLLASIAIGWAVTSMKVGNRRWSTGGFGFTILLNLGALNILWFIGNEWKAEVNSVPWWLHVHALLVMAGVAVVVALIAAVLGLGRLVTAQTTAEQPHLAMAASWLQHVALVSWLIAYALIYLYK